MPLKKQSKHPSQSREETYLYRSVPALPDAVRIGLAYPADYAVSMSSLGYLSLFRILDENPNASARRITNEDSNLQSVSDLEVVGFSFSFELDILAILEMLERYGISLHAADRDIHEPLIFAGGPVASANPEPYAPFFDFFIIGEGEEVLNELVVALKQHRSIRNRRELLEALALTVPGIYVPALVEVEYCSSGAIAAFHSSVRGLSLPIQKRSIINLDSAIASTPILTPDSVFSNTFLVEVMRGCAHRCSFCLTGYSMLPARVPQMALIHDKIQEGLKYTNKIGLLGALIADHPDFDQLCDFLQRVPNVRISAASLRADTLTRHIAETFRHGGQQSVTIAVETGSERLRKRINKHLSTESIRNAARIVSQAGIPALKLYLMVGLPGEEWSDLEDTVSLVKQLKQENPQLKLQIGCSTFVPKAATPFAWMDREPTGLLREKQEFLRKSLLKVADFRPSSPKWDYVQSLLSRGDRRLAPFLVEFVRQGKNLGALNRVLKQQRHVAGNAPVDLPPLDWYALRKRDRDEIFPWDILSLGVSKEILYRESGLKVEQSRD